MKVVLNDPFGERIVASSHARLSVLGSDVVVESTEASLTQLALEAFGNLPRLDPGSPTAELTLSMVLNDYGESWPDHASPPAPMLSSGNGLLCATIDAGNFVVVDSANARALVCVSRAMLQHPYLVRYELIELAILTLVARNRSLVSLHAACVGVGDRGCLIVGASGTGKSTLSLMALNNDMFVLSEDSTAIDPATLTVFGAPNFLHLRHETLKLLEAGPLTETISESPVIKRRSGVSKFEVDLRRLGGIAALEPLRLAATIFVTSEPAGSGGRVFQPVERDDLLARLRHEQPYATGLAGWDELCRKLTERPCFELRRTDPPAAAVRELRALLA